MKGFNSNIEKDTLENNNFRKVLYTGKHSQLVLMNIPSGCDIGEEIHDDTDQFFRFESGEGKVIIDGNEYLVSDGSAIIVPQGARHNVINVGTQDLKLYTLYAPAHHRDGVIHRFKDDAINDDEHFDGITTEK